jgi:hypothetical protein
MMGLQVAARTRRRRGLERQSRSPLFYYPSRLADGKPSVRFP